MENCEILINEIKKKLNEKLLKLQMLKTEKRSILNKCKKLDNMVNDEIKIKMQINKNKFELLLQEILELSKNVKEIKKYKYKLKFNC